MFTWIERWREEKGILVFWRRELESFSKNYYSKHVQLLFAHIINAWQSFHMWNHEINWNHSLYNQMWFIYIKYVFDNITFISAMFIKFPKPSYSLYKEPTINRSGSIYLTPLHLHCPDWFEPWIDSISSSHLIQHSSNHVVQNATVAVVGQVHFSIEPNNHRERFSTGSLESKRNSIINYNQINC